MVHLQRALGLLRGLPEDDGRRRLELDLQITLGHALIRARGYGVAEVGEAFARARRLAAAADTAQQISLLSGIGAYHYLRSESRASLKVGRDMVRLSRGGDPAAYVEGQRRIGGAFQQLGRLVPAQRHFERGLARFAPRRSPLRESAFTVEPYSTLLALLFYNLLLLGYPDRARARRAEAIELTRRAAHPLTLASTLHWSAMSAFLLRERRRAPRVGGRVRGADCRAHARTLHAVGPDLARLAGRRGRGRRERRRRACGRRSSTVRATGALFWSPLYTALLADVHRRAGDVDRALEVLGEALEHVERTDERVYEAELHRLKGAILLARAPSPTGEAEICLRRALAVARRQKARLWELRAATDLARLWQANGQSREARALLEPVYAWFTEGFDTPDLAEAGRLLGTCDSRMQPTLESGA